MMKQLFIVILNCILLREALAVKCYQCSSHDDPKGADNCGAYETFELDKHIPVDCSGDEAVTPGTFCMKITQQSPIGFIWDGRWRQVIRRCSSVAVTGVTGVCNWGIQLNGIYWEECYCAEEGCNSGSSISVSILLFMLPLLAYFLH